MAVALVGLAGKALGLGAIGTAFLQIGVGVGVAAIVRRRVANQNTAPRGIRTETSTQGGSQSQSIIMGRYSTAGHIQPAYSNGFNGSIQNAFRYRVYELADAPVHDLVGIWINDKYFEWNADFISTGPSTDFRTVRNTVYDGDYADKLWVKFYDGTQTAADPQMVARFGAHPTRPWLNTHIGTGVPYLIVAYKYDDDLWNGEPQCLAVVDGIVGFDFRTSTSAFTQNPVVLINQIMRGIPLPQGVTYGHGIPGAQFDATSWTAAANAQDQTAGLGIRQAGLEIPMASPENGGMTPWDAVDEIAKAGDIELCDMGGQWTIRSGPPGVPVATITDGVILYTQPQEMDPFRGITEKINTVRGTYVNPAARWASSELPLVSNAADVAEDGETRMEAISLAAVSDSTQAQKLLEAWRADARRGRVHKLTLPPEYSDLKCLESIAWTSARNGYTSKVFEIVEMWVNGRTFETTVVLRERDPTDYDIGALPAYTPPTLTRATEAAQTLPGAAAAAYTILDSNNDPRVSALRLSWTADAPGVRGVRYVIRNANTLAIVSQGTTQAVTDGELIVSDGIISNIAYEVQLEPVMVGKTAPTAWLPVTAPTSSLQFGDFGESVIPASALSVRNAENLFLDQDFRDLTIYTPTSGTFSLERTDVPESGEYLMSFPAGAAARVETSWMSINELSPYRVQIAAWMFSNAVGSGTITASFELATLAADGLITGTRILQVGTRTDSANTDLHTINIDTQAGERRFRFVFERAAGGTALGRIGGPRVHLRPDRELLTTDAKTDVTRSTTGTIGQSLVLVTNGWVELARITVDKKTSAPVDVVVDFEVSDTAAVQRLRVIRDGAMIEFEKPLPNTGANTALVAFTVTDDQTDTGAKTYILQGRGNSADTITLGPRKLIASHTGT